MKIVFFALFTLSLVSCTTTSSVLQADAVEKLQWTEVGALDLPDGYTHPRKLPDNPLDGADGAMGASLLCVQFGETPAGVIVDRIEGKGVAVFIGAAVPKALRSGSLARDLIRVEFVDKDGATIAAQPDAGCGGIAGLFFSPFGMDTRTLERVRILYVEDPRWDQD